MPVGLYSVFVWFYFPRHLGSANVYTEESVHKGRIVIYRSLLSFLSGSVKNLAAEAVLLLHLFSKPQVIWKMTGLELLGRQSHQEGIAGEPMAGWPCWAGVCGGISWKGISVFNPQMLEGEVNLLKLAQRFSGAQEIKKKIWIGGTGKVSFSWVSCTMGARRRCTGQGEQYIPP